MPLLRRSVPCESSFRLHGRKLYDFVNLAYSPTHLYKHVGMGYTYFIFKHDSDITAIPYLAGYPIMGNLILREL
jgi:hypothetical protein